MGMGGRRLRQTMALIEQGMTEGSHIGAQLYVSLRGQVMADLGIGEARPGVAMTRDTLMLWLSAGKPITAVAVAQLWEEGKLQLDDPIARHVPEFAANGKDAVTLRHVLTHTGGFRAAMLSNWELRSWEQSIDRICAAKLEPGWVPGRKAGYHAAAGWLILGEVVRRVARRSFLAYVREQILTPLAMHDTWFSLDADQYAAYGDRVGILYNTEKPEPVPNGWDTPEQAAIPRPGASARGPVRQLGFFYETLLNHGLSPRGTSPQRILTPQTVEAITARHRTGMLDQTFRHAMDWGLGFLINSAMYGEATVPYSYGPHASSRTFGHGGAQCATGFADPEHGLVVALVLNGTPGEPRHQQRMRPILAAIYDDLGLRS